MHRETQCTLAAMARVTSDTTELVHQNCHQ
jgi:hypothetical protein